MAYMIKESSCTGCSACVNECPNNAILERSFAFVIDPGKCTECIGFFDEPQCVSICPIPKTCIINPDVPRFAAVV
ncbi:MAG: 4Fe-4S binding protein [Acidobacteriaceae bacterium]